MLYATTLFCFLDQEAYLESCVSLTILQRETLRKIHVSCFPLSHPRYYLPFDKASPKLPGLGRVHISADMEFNDDPDRRWYFNHFRKNSQELGGVECMQI